MSNRVTKKHKNPFSTLESESPVDLYWLHRNDGAEGLLEEPVSGGNRTIISEKFWDDFVIVAKAVKLRNRDADIYDAFNFIREHMLGGWTYIEDSTFIRKIDAEVEREYRKEQHDPGRG